MKFSVRNILLGTILFMGATAGAGYLLNQLTDRHIDQIKEDNYREVAHSMRQSIQSHIKEKQSSMLSIGLSIAGSEMIADFLSGRAAPPDLKKLSQSLKDETDYKNVWFHVVDNQGISRYRSWTSKTGDSLLDKRLDVVEMIERPAIRNTISTGIFTMTFKSLVPVFDTKKRFLGSFETIAHFNSIIKTLREHRVETVILVDPSYKKQLSKALTGTFIKDYYLVNADAKPELLRYLLGCDFPKLMGMNDYMITPEHLVTLYILPDIEGKPMGYFLLFKELKSLDFSNIEFFRQALKTSVTLGFAVIVAVLLLVMIWRRARQTRTINQRLEKMVKQRTTELMELNRNLEKRVHDAVSQQRQQEQFLIQQNKLASMSEMLTNISHHWRQPLNVLALNIQDIGDAYRFGELNQTYLDEAISQSMGQINYMSKTIDNFKNFFDHTSEKKEYSLEETLEHVLTLLYPEISGAGITIVKFIKPVTIVGNESELRQVLLNVVTNAIEAIARSGLSDGQITIMTKSTKKQVTITVEDNAGGIDEAIKEKIFEPYFTTKFKSKGVGLSLYMSKIIVEKSMEGSLEVENTASGAKFVLTFPISK